MMTAALAILGPVILLLFERTFVHLVVGWTAIGCLPIALLKLRDRRPLLILERDGFRDPRSRLGFIAWSDVRRVRLWRFSELVYLRLAVSRFRDDVRVNLTLSALAPEEVLREVGRRCDAPSGR
jgi:hypothetical protein